MLTILVIVFGLSVVAALVSYYRRETGISRERAREAARLAQVRRVQAHADHRLHQLASNALQAMLDEARRQQ